MPSKHEDMEEYVHRIENRKKAAGLGHEFGAGSRCRKCGDACPGLDLHFWRKICKLCKCGIELHAVQEDDAGAFRIQSLCEGVFQLRVQELLTSLSPLFPPAPSPEKNAPEIEWLPPNLPASLASKYFSQLPPEFLPASNRLDRLHRQIPRQDFDSTLCHNELNTEEKSQHTQHVSKLKSACGIGLVVPDPSIIFQPPAQQDPSPSEECQTPESTKYVCQHCDELVHAGELAVFAERVGLNVLWHAKCFVCSICGELLQDLIYFQQNQQLFCARHFGELEHPRCAGCHELIFAKQFTQAEGHDWHIIHFCCTKCDRPLTGERYVAREEGPYCLECYKANLAKTCQGCKRKIEADVKRVSHDDLHWHATKECLYCKSCQTSLADAGKKLFIKQGDVFCTPNCARQYKAGEASKEMASVKKE